MESIITVVLFIVILGFLVFIHELGHFTAAKLSKIPVDEFAIGFGPVLFSKKIRETVYRIRALPLGGFVSLEGEHSQNSPNGFRNRSFLIKFFVLIAGVFMNTLAAIFFLAIFLSTHNRIFFAEKYADYSFNNVEKSYEFFPINILNVQKELGWTGFEKGDSLVEINGEKIESEAKFQKFIDDNRGREVEITTINIETLDLTTKSATIGDLPFNGHYPVIIDAFSSTSKVTQYLSVGDIILAINGDYFDTRAEFKEKLDEVQGTTADFLIYNEQLGIETNVQVPLPEKVNNQVLGAGFHHLEGIEYSVLSSGSKETFFVQYKNNVLAPFSFTYDMALYQMKSLGGLISNAVDTGDFSEASKAVGGPLAVGGQVSEIVKYQIYDVLIILTALISLSFAIFNVLPIPALDGGQIAIAAAESIRGKRINDNTVNAINFAGFAFLMLLSLLIVIKDINQLNIIPSLVDAAKGIIGR
ncbi:RIP metalloprotease RseP [Candidatus Dojkabacteria bacterium]|uniref:Zinc metalloprotease n=1 Tax=Candidatus Dojkabacteria bacterium TaxID=2099670 RepID=A0A955L9B5_9BACT|nr:RIP metalloprotease RseP [Candidatus Dojkabacteria bacterium]